ncbi:hypothetical protein [Pseudoalteromonas sp. A25]|uniref:hypothetical protein n=1 Tax=Pseudoalteromonas sp. A25 TaxID=116092 RepID=UPI001260A1C8|nr:hypothetical protein [Pseudoalteromonas sp. A25]
MVVKSHHQPYAHASLEQNALLLQTPQVYYQLESQIELSALPVHVIKALLALDVNEVKFEWAIRLAQQSRFKASRLYWLKYYNKATAQQRERLKKVFVEQEAFSELERLKNQFTLKEPLYTLLASEHGALPSMLSHRSLATWNLPILSSPQSFSEQCKNSILLVSDHYRGMKKLNALKAQYLKKPEPQAYSYCFTEVFYIGNIMMCKGEQNQFAKCNAEYFIAQYEGFLDNIDYLIMMTKSGLANVSNGMMTLTSSSDYQVFLHELMHFSGFEDEYAVAPSKARWLCSIAGQHAPNLVVSKHSPEQGWYKSNTCKNGALQAFKPSKNWSIMQFQERPLSHKYRQLWQNAINSKRYQLPTFSSWKTSLKKAALNERASEI